MGGFTSRQFEEILEEEEPVKAEPQSSPQSARLLDAFLDPRSPSSDITRTPIQVEKTPESVLDPRSPTSGITRTPIYDKNENSKNAMATGQTPILGFINRLNITDEDNAVVNASPDDVPPPLIEEDEEKDVNDVDSEAIVEPKAQEDVVSLNRSLSEPDLTVQDDRQLLVRRNVPARLSFTEPAPARKKASQSHFVIHPGSDITPASVDKPAQHSPRRHLKDGPQRSPLSTRNVDRNTPRAIVQRKQAKRLTSLKSTDGVSLPLRAMLSPVKKYQVIDDKENAEV